MTKNPKNPSKNSPNMRTAVIGDQVLRTKAAPSAVQEIRSSDTRSLLEGMIATLDAKSNAQSVAVGLAGPQVHVPKQVVVVRSLPDFPLIKLFNPVVNVINDSTIFMLESCISVPKKLGVVKRSSEIVIDYLNEQAEEMKLECTGWYAGLMQHELDHLQGVLFVDKADYVESEEEFFEQDLIKKLEGICTEGTWKHL